MSDSSRLVKLYTVKEELIRVHSMDSISIRHCDLSHSPPSFQRVADAAEVAQCIEKAHFSEERIPIRKQYLAQRRGLGERCHVEHYLAIDDKTAGIFGIEIEENQRLKDHADEMQHIAVIRHQQTKNYQHDANEIHSASWFRRLIWAFTGNI